MLSLVAQSPDCVDCLKNIDPSNKGEMITCIVTIVIGAVIRVIEKRKMSKNK
jgi:hypothetical protein